MKIEYQPIGKINTPFKKPEGVPIQPKAGKNITGTVEIFPEFADGLKDLDGFSHIYLIYHFHRSKLHPLFVVPFLDTVERGVFSTRAPNRPNLLGISIVKLKKVERNLLHIRGVDILDGTPLLDIKPFISELEPDEIRIGWLEEKSEEFAKKKADDRFSRDG